MTPAVADGSSAAQVGTLLNAIDAFDGTFVVRSALQLAPLVFVRPGELRRAEWSEINLAAAEWRMPAERMKMREAHIVPLSTQAVAILHSSGRSPVTRATCSRRSAPRHGR
nr:tyrosine-type recombinase/integrase [Luteitalea sp.]